MPGFELDVTKPVGEVSVTGPDGKIVYDVMAITKEPMLMFQMMSEGIGDDVNEQALQIINTLSSVMVPQNGGPPAGEHLLRLYDEGFLGLNHLRQLGEYVQSTAVGNPPA